MRKAILSRRMIALLAAYVVALQALLLPLAVAAGNPFINSLCTSFAAERQAPAQPAPASHDTGCPCAAGCGMACCAQGLAGSPQLTLTPAWSPGYVMAPPPVPAPFVRTFERRPQNPRAPPVA